MRVSITVNGKRYGGWTSATVTRGIDALSGSYDLGVTDRWADQAQSWPIREGDECTVWIGDTQIITGYVDTREFAFDAQTHTASVRGRDRTADLVDCDATPREFRRASALTICQLLAEEYGIRVTAAPDALVDAGAALADPIVVDPGDQSGEVIARVCRTAGVLPVADGLGGLQIVRGSSSRVPVDLVEGVNIVAARAIYSQADRYSTYTVIGSRTGTANVSRASARAIRGVAEDPSARPGRHKIVRADQPVDVASAGRRAEWEAAVRAAKGDSVTITVRGWEVPGTSTPWPINAIVRVKSPRLRIDGDLLIERVTYTISGDQGERTQIDLTRPDAYRPVPVVQVPKGRMGGAWRELRTGWAT